jgi:Ca2+-binding RTX toxin-like protein
MGIEGDDRLVGGPGADLLLGGLGQYTFVFLALA